MTTQVSNGLMAAFGLSFTVIGMTAIGDIIWSYLPIGTDGQTLSEWVSETTGVGA